MAFDENGDRINPLVLLQQFRMNASKFYIIILIS